VISGDIYGYLKGGDTKPGQPAALDAGQVLPRNT